MEEHFDTNCFEIFYFVYYIWTIIVKIHLGGFKEIIKTERNNRGLPLRKVAAVLDIDQSILSKIEKGERKAKREQVQALAKYFGLDEKGLIVSWMADNLVYEYGDDDLALKAMQAAEQQIKYNKKKK